MALITRIYRLAFILIYSIYWCSIKMQSLFDRFVKLIFNYMNRISKIQESMMALGKVPQQVLLAIQITPQIKLNDKLMRQSLQSIFEIIDIINLSRAENVSVFFWGLDQLHIQDTEYEEKLKNLKVIQFDQFYQNITKQCLQWKKKSIPLLISLSSYNSLNCIPFNCLIDAEFSFCPPILECNPSDIHKCFQQYSNSKQRHGR